jgi:hypothetical protein
MRCVDTGYDPCLIIVAVHLVLQNENVSLLQCFKKHVNVIAIRIKTGQIKDGRVKLARTVPCEGSGIDWWAKISSISSVCKIIEK